jgi:hypothetical protein
MKVKNSLTLAQHNTILRHMEECLQIDSTYLLVEDRELLEADFEKLIHGPTPDKLEWLAEINTAGGAADHIARESCHALCSCYCSGPNLRMGMEYEDKVVDHEGSMKWRRQCKR